MKKPSITVKDKEQIQDACQWLYNCLLKGLESGPVVIVLDRVKRSLAQNAKLWPMLEDIRKHQPLWHQREMSTWDYKDLFTSAIKGQDLIPNIDGNGFVALGERTSEYNKAQMSELIEYMYFYGAGIEVQWSEKSLEIYQEYKEAQNG